MIIILLQSISNEIYNQINQSIDYSSNIDTNQTVNNIQSLYIHGNKSENRNESKGPLFDQPQFKTLKDQLYSSGVSSGPEDSNQYSCIDKGYETPTCPFLWITLFIGW